MVVAISATANKANLFIYDQEDLYKEFATLNTIENYVKNNDVTYTQLTTKNKEMASALNFKDVYNLSLAEAEPPLGIPSFWWGCLFGVIGILLVYLLTEDKAEVNKAFKGCIVGSLISLVLYIIYVALIVGATASSV